MWNDMAEPDTTRKISTDMIAITPEATVSHESTAENLPLQEPATLCQNQVPEFSTADKPTSDTVDGYDVALFVNSDAKYTMTDTEIYDSIKNIYVPPKNFKFPFRLDGITRRLFQPLWLTNHSWLKYSKRLDGGFCLCCVLFRKKYRDSILIDKPLTSSTNAKERLKLHENNTCHRNSMIAFSKFIAIMKSEENASISDQTRSGVAVRKRTFKGRNRNGKTFTRAFDAVMSHLDALTDTTEYAAAKQKKKLHVPSPVQSRVTSDCKQRWQNSMSLLKTAIVAGRQHFFCQGYVGGLNDSSYNKENFRALLEFRVDAGDAPLSTCLKRLLKSNRGMLSMIQKELMHSVGIWIRQQLIDEIRRARFFSVLVNDIVAASKTKQLALTLRYVDSQHIIREEFIDFINSSTTKDMCAAELILQHIQYLGLDCNLIRGQGYDGDGDVARRQRNIAGSISQKFPLALYTHCNSHFLDLSIVKSCEIQAVHNVFDMMKEIALYLNNCPERQQLFEEQVSSLVTDLQNGDLKNLCKMKWVEQPHAFKVFRQFYTAIFKTLEVIAHPTSAWSYENVTAANRFLLSITQSQFLVTFFLLYNCLSYINRISESLQAGTILKSLYETTLSINALDSVKRNVDVYHQCWYEEARKFGLSLNTFLPNPDIAQDCSLLGYYRETVTIPFLDHLLAELNGRFLTVQQTFYQALCILPIIVKCNPEWKSSVQKAFSCFLIDLPNANYIDDELNNWECKWKTFTGNLPEDVQSAVSCCDKLEFPNIAVLLQLLSTVPLIKSHFSKLPSLRTYLRSTVPQERFSELALLFIYSDMKLNLEEIITIFAKEYPQKVRLIDKH